VAHEIKNPLNAIALRLETLRARIADDAPEAEPEIDLVSNEVQRLDRVVHTFLDLNQPMELNVKQFDPAELAASVLEIMRPAATQASVELELVKTANPFTVSADRGLIEQGLLNVINNAIQALGGSELEGRLVKTSVSHDNGNCVVAVSDNGPGMPASVRDRIFDPYYTTKSTGSGIGLALTKRAMELHRGSISVESSPGQGTTMVLSFPLSLVLLGVLVFSSGCFLQKTPTVAVPVATPPTAAASQAASPESAPTPTATSPHAVPAPVPVQPQQPSIPATSSGKPSPFPPATTSPPKPAPITPTPPPALGAILTADQRKQLEAAYQSDLKRTNTTLNGLSGRTLTSQQTDTVNRARAFIRQAAQYHERDLTTAAEIARRARVLIQDLAGALK
jgi:two-component sensor histidine kinase